MQYLRILKEEHIHIKQIRILKPLDSLIQKSAMQLHTFGHLRERSLGLYLGASFLGETIFPCLSIMLAGKQITLEIGWRNSIAGDLNHCLMRLLMKMSFS